MTTAGNVYENTYAWIMTLDGGKVIDVTAFYDSVAFNELWETSPIWLMNGMAGHVDSEAS